MSYCLMFHGILDCNELACWYDDYWEPPMFYKNSNEKTNWGEFILEYLSDDKHFYNANVSPQRQ